MENRIDRKVKFGSLYQAEGLLSDIWFINDTRYQGNEYTVQPTFCELYL